MIRHLTPAILFGCGSVPGIAQPVAEDTIIRSADWNGTSFEFSAQRSELGETAKPPTGWVQSFEFWSSRSREAMIEAINAGDREIAELHEFRALANVSRALGAITYRSPTEV